MAFEDITRELAKIPAENAAVISAEVRKMELHYIHRLEEHEREWGVTLSTIIFIFMLMIIAVLLILLNVGA